MSKLAAGLLLVVGLGIGLWLGFNPKAHQEVVQTWNRANTAMVHMQTHVAVKTPTIKLPVSTGKPSAQPQVAWSHLWRQITTAFEALLQSAQRAWVSVVASLRNVNVK